MVDEVGVRISLKDRQQFAREVAAAVRDINKIPAASKRSRSEFTLAERGVRSFASGFSSAMGSAASSVAHFAKRAVQSLVAAGTAVAFFGVKAAAQFENAEVAFTHFFKSGDKALVFLEEMQDFANKTPFEFPQLITASQRMLAYGFAAEDVMKTLTTVGDAASALGRGADGINSITLALGQMKQKGRVMAQELNQLSEVGIGGLRMLADAAGVTTAQMMKEIERGAIITSETALPILLAGMEKQFGGMMKKQNLTIGGMWSNFVDEARSGLRKAVMPFKENIKDAIRGASQGMAGFFAGVGGQNTEKKGAVGFFQRLGFTIRTKAVPGLIELGRRAMPILKGLGRWFKEHSPAFIKFAKYVLGGIRDGFKTIGDTIKRNKPELTRLGNFITDTLMPALGWLVGVAFKSIAAFISTWLENLAAVVRFWDEIVQAVKDYYGFLNKIPVIGWFIPGDGGGGGGADPKRPGSTMGGGNGGPGSKWDNPLQPALSVAPPPTRATAAEAGPVLGDQVNFAAGAVVVYESRDPEKTRRAVAAAVGKKEARA